jgi:hypothetical protein
MFIKKLLSYVPYFGIFWSFQCGELRNMKTRQFNLFVFYHFGTMTISLLLFGFIIITQIKHNEKQPIPKRKESTQVCAER